MLQASINNVNFCREVPHYIASCFNRLTGENGQRKTDVAAGPGQEKC